MIDADRLSELATLDPGDTPDDQRVAITAGDLRDLVSLIPVVRCALYNAQISIGCPTLWRAVDELRAKGAER